jgi:hypothetical protein
MVKEYSILNMILLCSAVWAKEVLQDNFIDQGSEKNSL